MTKKTVIIIAIFLLAGAVFLAAPSQPASHLLKEGPDKNSYALGSSLASAFAHTNPEFDSSAVCRGLSDALVGRAILAPADLKNVLIDYNRSRHGGQFPADWGRFIFFSRFHSLREKVSYAFGEDAGLSCSRIHMDLIPAVIDRGMKDTFAGMPLLNLEETSRTLAQLYHDWAIRRTAERKAKGEENLRKGEAFLAANKDKPGVQTLPCGLQYKVITDGTGSVPELENFVVLKYRGIKLDGSVFANADQPSVFAMGGILHGWSEALQQMKVGSKWELYIPADHGFGEDGAPGVEPNETLIYDLQLVQVLTERPPVANTSD
jgi:FKBP-type peptidyl-prolyl cis-trans isomerase